MPAGFVSFKDLGVKAGGATATQPSNGFVALPSDALSQAIPLDEAQDDTAPPQVKGSSAKDAFWGHAKRSALPTAAFVAGAGPGASIGASAGAVVGLGVADAVTVPVGTLVGALVGGGIAAYGAGKAQDKALEAMPEQAKAWGIDNETLAAQREEHPVASVAGELAPQLLTARPTLGTARDLLGLAGAKAALKAGTKVAGGAVVGGGVNAAQQYAMTGEIDPTEVALNAAGGAVMTDPWLLHKPLDAAGRAVVPKRFLAKGDALLGRESGFEAERPVALDPAEPADLLTPRQLSLPAPERKAQTFEPQTLTDPRVDEQFSVENLNAHLTGALKTAGHDPDLSARDVGRLSATLNKAMAQGDTAQIVDGLTREQARTASRMAKLEQDREDLAADVAEGRINAEEARNYTKTFATTERVLTQRKALIDPALEIAARYEQSKATYDKAYAGDVPPADDVLVTPAPAREPAQPIVPSGDVQLVTEPERGAAFGRRPTMPGEPQPRIPEPAADTALAEGLRFEHADATREAQFSNMGPTDAISKARADALDKVIQDPNTRNPTARFTAALKKLGVEQHITAEEAARIGKFEDARAAFTAPPERVEASPDESGNFGIPERKAQEPQAVEAPAPEPAAVKEEVEGNVRTRAEAHAEKLGSSRRAWFLRGVDHELGTHESVAPTSKSKANWFQEGRDFVGQERGHQDRERAGDAVPADNSPARVPSEPKPAASEAKVEPKAEPAAERPLERPPAELMPKSRGGRATFTRTVDEAVGTKLTAKQGQMLKAAEGLVEEMGGKDVRTIPTAELWTMLDEALAENDAQGGLTDKKLARRGFSDKHAASHIETAEAVGKYLKRKLDRMGLHDVGLKISTRIGLYMEHGAAAHGDYSPVQNLIRVAFDGANPNRTLYHEAIHAMRTMDLFTPTEWRALERLADKSPLMKEARELYGDAHSTELMREEVIAESFARWANKKDVVDVTKGSLIQRVFEKMRDVLASVKQAFEGAGFKSAESIFEAVHNGELGGRARGVQRQGERGYGGSLAERFQDERVTRRGLIKGTAAALAASPAHAAGKMLERTNLRGNTAVADAVATGKLQTTIEAIRDTTKNPAYREIARIIALGGVGDAKIKVEPQDELGMRRGETDATSGDVTVYRSNKLEDNGFTEETVLHEGIHAYLAKRYFSLAVYGVERNRELTGSAKQEADQFVDKFTNEIWKPWSDMMSEKFPELVGDANSKTEWGSGAKDDAETETWAEEAWNSPDELFVRSMTDPDLQAFLRAHDMKGNVIKARDPNSIWTKLVDWVRGMLGMKAETGDALSHILDATNSVLKAAALDAPTGKFAGKVAEMNHMERTHFERARKAKIKAEKATVVNLKDLGKKSWTWMMSTEDLAHAASKLLPSAKRFIEANSKSHSLARQFEDRLSDIKRAYEALPHELKSSGKGSVNELLDDMTIEGKWGYKPSWNAKAKVDPEMAKRFDALPKDAQDVIKGILLYNNEAREQLAAATIKAVEAEYNPQIEQASDPKHKSDLEAEKRRKLALYSRAFDAREDVPYSPRSRSGDFAAVGMSKEFLEAKQAKDFKRVDELRQDPKHYWVRFYESLGEAKAAADRVRGPAYPHVDHFQRDAMGDLDVGGKDMYLAFNQLRSKLQGVLRDDPNDPSTKKLYQLATDLYLHALADSSARKGELKSNRVAGKDPVTGEALDMFRAFVTRGQATAHFVAHLSNTKEVFDSIEAMHDEAESYSGQNDTKRADAQRFKNELLWHYVDNLNRKPNKMVEKLLRANSVWSLLLKPGYHIQNSTQTVGISLPQIAAVSSYPRAWREIIRAYGEVMPLVKDWTGDRLDIRKLQNPGIRKLAQDLQDRGRLGTGMSMELGSWEMNGNGLLPALYNPIDRAMRQLPQNIEDVNRLVAGIAAYRAMKTKGATDAHATEFASQVIAETHGDYSHFNTPRALKGNELMRIPLQYRKFQMIMAALNAKMFHRAFTSKDISPQQAWVARRAMAYTMAHQVAMAGIKGLPGVGAIGGLTMMLLGKHAGDWEHEAKEKLEDFFGKDSFMAGLLYKGAPYEMLGADMSQTLGMSTIFSPAPFAQPPKAEGTKSEFLATAGQLLLGSIGNTAWKMAEGTQFMREGDQYRALEDFLPSGVGGVLKAGRYSKEGLTARNGDTLLKPEELSFMDQLMTALSLPSAKISDAQEARGHVMDVEARFKDQATLLKRQYVNAHEAHDGAKMAKLRTKWNEMQKERREAGLKVQPLSGLVKAPAEQRKRNLHVKGGVPYTEANRKLVEDTVD